MNVIEPRDDLKRYNIVRCELQTAASNFVFPGGDISSLLALLIISFIAPAHLRPAARSCKRETNIKGALKKNKTAVVACEYIVGWYAAELHCPTSTGSLQGYTLCFTSYSLIGLTTVHGDSLNVIPHHQALLETWGLRCRSFRKLPRLIVHNPLLGGLYRCSRSVGLVRTDRSVTHDRKMRSRCRLGAMHSDIFVS
jgi:hypothetical protein